MMFTEDLDIGLITSAEVINRSLAREIKGVAIKGGGRCVVQYGLIGDRDGEDRPEDESCLSGTEGERDVKSQDEAKNIGSVMDGP
jgi:hypothetical protein